MKSPSKLFIHKQRSKLIDSTQHYTKIMGISQLPPICTAYNAMNIDTSTAMASTEPALNINNTFCIQTQQWAHIQMVCSRNMNVFNMVLLAICGAQAGYYVISRYYTLFISHVRPRITITFTGVDRELGPDSGPMNECQLD